MIKKLAVLLGVLGVTILLVAVMAYLPISGEVEQPIAFSHRLHAGEMGLDCTVCHLYARTGVRATIPNIEVCSVCHWEAPGESEELTRLLTYVESETPIPWRKVSWVPDHVYFSHRRHSALAGIECQTCHGLVQEREEPLHRQAFEGTMERCMECHEESGASNDCIDCHR